MNHSLPIQQRIEVMNRTFNLPTNTPHQAFNLTPAPAPCEYFADQGNERIRQLITVLNEEIEEGYEITYNTFDPTQHPTPLTRQQRINRMVQIADWLADLNVYIRSEATRWGIDLDAVTHIVLDSQESKLDPVTRQPIYAPDGSKFIKGPNYQPPEPQLAKYFDP